MTRRSSNIGRPPRRGVPRLDRSCHGLGAVELEAPARAPELDVPHAAAAGLADHTAGHTPPIGGALGQPEVGRLRAARARLQDWCLVAHWIRLASSSEM